MKIQLLIIAALAICATAQELAPLVGENAAARIPGQYIVVFEKSISDDDFSSHLENLRGIMGSGENATNVILREFNIDNFHAYSAKMDDKLRDSVRSMKHVDYVECNQKVQASACNLQQSAPWGLVRTTYRDLPYVDDYSYEPYGGSSVYVFVVDTGIETTHPDFGGRAIWGADFIDDPSPRTDLNGHGTHCAGTIMSNTYGVAKRATSVAVRVLDENGSGSLDGIIDGMIYIINQKRKYPGMTAIASMSLGAGRSNTVNYVVDVTVQWGIHVVVAAGNENQDACNVSPASAESCITVGASDKSDQFAWFSNWGTCEDIIAPGVDILSTWLNGGTNTISGTSMATPHVAGVVAKYLSEISPKPSPQDMKSFLLKQATPNKIDGLVGEKATTPNLLVFKECL